MGTTVAGGWVLTTNDVSSKLRVSLLDYFLTIVTVGLSCGLCICLYVMCG